MLVARRIASWGVSFSLAATLSSCGSDESSPVEPAPVQDASAAESAADDAAVDTVDAPGDEPPAAYRVKVLAPEESWGWNWRAVEGATVAVQRPSGDTEESKSDSEGYAIFEPVDWQQGPVNVSAHVEGFMVMSYVGVTQDGFWPDDNGELRLLVFGGQPGESVRASGTVTGMEDPSNNTLIVRSQDNMTWHAGAGPSWSGDVPKGEGFTLLAAELGSLPPSCAGCSDGEVLRWARVSQAASDTDVEVAIDLVAAEVPSTKVGARVAFPDAGSALAGAKLFWSVSGAATSLLTHTGPAAGGGALDLTIEYATWDDSELIQTSALLYVDPSLRQAHSVIASYGPPEDGIEIAGFLEPPTLLHPADPSVPIAITDTIEWESATPTDTSIILIEQKWAVLVAAGQSSVRIPRPPSTVDVLKLLGTAPLEAKFLLRDDWNPATLSYRKFASSPVFELQP